jgi:hypothetical protein
MRYTPPLHTKLTDGPKQIRDPAQVSTSKNQKPTVTKDEKSREVKKTKAKKRRG